MNYIQHNSIANFIFGGLPMTVIRRLDALLEPTKKEVLDMKKQLDKSKVANQWK